MQPVASESSLLVWVLFIMAAALIVYTLVLMVEQHRTMMFENPRGAVPYVIAAVLVVFGVGFYFMHGRTLSALATLAVILAFAFFMAGVRAGVGRSALYLDGVRYSWSKVNSAKVSKDHGEVVVTFGIKNLDRSVRLKGADKKDVAEFVRDLSRTYGFKFQ